MRWLLILLLSSSALAQEQPPFAPFTVQEHEFRGVMEYLAKQPMGVVEPVVQWFRQKEAEAQKQAKPKEKPEK